MSDTAASQLTARALTNRSGVFRVLLFLMEFEGTRGWIIRPDSVASYPLRGYIAKRKEKKRPGLRPL